MCDALLEGVHSVVRDPEGFVEVAHLDRHRRPRQALGAPHVRTILERRIAEHWPPGYPQPAMTGQGRP
jgi:hypothetical protein